MPRSPVSQPPPSLSLQRHLRTIDQLPPLLTSESLFDNDHPLELEVGSGKGLFLQTASSRRPETNFVGIEIAHKYAVHAAGRLAKRGQDNALVISADAQPLLDQAIRPASLAAVHIYFPDPWWKRKHKKRRVVNPQAVRHIHRALVIGGTLHFWTDVLEYFETAIEAIAAEVPQFGPPIPDDPQPLQPAEDSPEPSDVGHRAAYRTHFERRSMLHEIPVYRVRYQRRD